MQRIGEDRRPTAHEINFLIMVALAPFAHPFDGWIHGQSVFPMDWAFLATAFAWGLALLMGRARIRPGRFYRMLALYWAALAVSAAFSEDAESSALKLVGQTYLVGLAVLSYNLTGSVRGTSRAAFAWLAGTAVTVIASLVGTCLFYRGVTDPGVNLILSPFGSLPPGDYPRVRGFTIHANVLCMYLVSSCLFALALRATERLRASLFWVLTAAVGLVALHTLSPGLGGLFLVVGAWARLRLVDHPRTGTLAAAAGAAAAVAFFLAALVAPTPYGWNEFEILGGLGPTFEPSTRAVAWVTACDTIAMHPIFGSGLGTAVSDVAYRDPDGGLSYLTDAHNVWLSVAGQSGILGLLAFAALVGYLLRGLPIFTARGSERDVLTTALALAVLGGFVYQGLTGSFEETRFVWILFGMLAAVKEGSGVGDP
jgi:putative inorganic carbon (hco3(-)) transporter